MKKNFIRTLWVATLTLSCLGGLKVFLAYNRVGSSLVMKNIEALTNGEPDNGSNFAKEYETGTGIYVTSISGNYSGDLTEFFGKRLSENQIAYLQSILTDVVIESEKMNDWRMTCLPDMGCYTSCQNEDWHPGSHDRKTYYGCGYD